MLYGYQDKVYPNSAYCILDMKNKLNIYNNISNKYCQLVRSYNQKNILAKASIFF